MKDGLKNFLDKKVVEYNQPFFIEKDPVCIPHLFSLQQDIEISGFFAAIFAWGNRATTINKSRQLMSLMDNAPYQFCLAHSASDVKRLLHFRHRTFNATDLLYFVRFLSHHYAENTSLESAFFSRVPAHQNIKIKGATKESHPDRQMEIYLNSFYHYFFSLSDVPSRTKKHIAAPEKNATCKRLNMYLRWMVRRDNNGVDFGLWNNITPAQLICPVDVHVARVARHLNLLERKATDWQAALEITHYLRTFDAIDPVKYDFALFNLGVAGDF